jgi:hypothetical protein
LELSIGVGFRHDNAAGAAESELFNVLDGGAIRVGEHEVVAAFADFVDDGASRASRAWAR